MAVIIPLTTTFSNNPNGLGATPAIVQPISGSKLLVRNLTAGATIAITGTLSTCDSSNGTVASEVVTIPAAITEVYTIGTTQEIQTVNQYAGLLQVESTSTVTNAISVYSNGRATKFEIRWVSNTSGAFNLSNPDAFLRLDTHGYNFGTTHGAPTEHTVTLGSDLETTMGNIAAAINTYDPKYAAVYWGVGTSSTARANIYGSDYPVTAGQRPSVYGGVDGYYGYISLIDRVPCDRSYNIAAGFETSYTVTAYGPTASGSSIASDSSVLNTGSDGMLLTTITPPNKVKMLTTALDDEALTQKLMPANGKFVSNWINVAGRRAAIYLEAEDVTTALPCSYEVALDMGYPRTGLTAITSLDNNHQVIIPAEQLINYLRLKITNPNTGNVSINAKLMTDTGIKSQ